MRRIVYFFSVAIAIILCSCGGSSSNTIEKEEKRTETGSLPVSIFPKGEVIEGENFNGTAWLKRLMTDSGNFDVVVSDVIFEAGARNNWHSHPGGQILIATSGKGYYQEKGKTIQVLKPGDVVAIPADVTHWHGAAPDSAFTHLAINTKVALGPTVWYKKVTDTEYNSNTNK